MLLLNTLATFAPTLAARDEDVAAFFIIFGAGCCGFIIGIGLCALLCWFLSNCFKAIPEQYRLMQPNQVWLLLIPFFSIVWIFFVVLRLADSYKNYFNAQGITDVGDCGRTIGLWWCILTCVSVIPYLNLCSGIPTLVLMILFLVKANELKNRILRGPGTNAFPTQ